MKGALREVRRADEIGAENIERMNLEDSPSELDIQTKSGKIVESKSAFGYNERRVDSEFEKKLIAMRDDPKVSLDENTLEFRATKIRDDSIVRNKINEWEEKVASSSEWNNADVDIEVINERTGEKIEN